MPSYWVLLFSYIEFGKHSSSTTLEVKHGNLVYKVSNNSLIFFLHRSANNPVVFVFKSFPSSYASSQRLHFGFALVCTTCERCVLCNLGNSSLFLSNISFYSPFISCACESVREEEEAEMQDRKAGEEHHLYWVHSIRSVSLLMHLHQQH